jgi:SAM-dependent methyltransferase
MAEDSGASRADDGHDHGDDADRMDRLDDPSTFRYFSGEELRAALDPDPGWTVADLGSGTGLFADEVAPTVERLYAVDRDPAMHRRYGEKGLPDNVAPLTADVADVPLPEDSLDAALSVRTFHHGVREALPEIRRLLRPGGRFVVADWSATATGEFGRDPKPDRFFEPGDAASALVDAGFRVRESRERWETYLLVATRR